MRTASGYGKSYSFSNLGMVRAYKISNPFPSDCWNNLLETMLPQPASACDWNKQKLNFVSLQPNSRLWYVFAAKTQNQRVRMQRLATDIINIQVRLWSLKKHQLWNNNCLILLTAVIIIPSVLPHFRGSNSPPATAFSLLRVAGKRFMGKLQVCFPWHMTFSNKAAVCWRH